ncbi:methylmalonyl-CoA mutase [Formosa agariphila KMM 3901]|uniref:Methylmalonyl-CoA mutase n=1 Tax=Formosa agariphila (strain DSM 15362 / KCTC 12365 / LMG 23005 / KMM 3901 / M-2Alg 35-1) TaxID=1347342 RepID=T2KNA6_FORAG|nr:methylmalonyl-CoA mutase family protein [Formosa agariphila]CDF79948.1 methylmalonyl-CoA mutase [Formosa agariphila KMM 3901]
MSRKNLQHITLKTTEASARLSKDNLKASSDSYAIDSNNTLVETEGLHDLNFAAGIPPFLRGILSTMYITAPWTTSQSSNFNTVDDCNAYYKRLYKNGQRHFTFNVNSSAYSPQTLEDFKSFFKDIPLNEITISLPYTCDSIALLAFYTVVSESQGLPKKTLNGVVNIDTLQGLNIKNTNQNSEKETSELFSDTLWHLPNFIAYSISNESLHHLNLSPQEELALMLISGDKLLKSGLNSGLDIDTMASRLSFTLVSGLNLFTEISKLRAARILWAKLIKSYHPKHEQSQALHIQSNINTKQVKLNKRDNSVSKSVIQATAAVFGGTQSIQTQTTNTSTLDSERLNNNMQLFLQKETQISRTVDPWAGSYVVETRTSEIAKQVWDMFETFQNTKRLPEELLKTLSHVEINTLEKLHSTPTSSLTHINRDEDAVTRSLQKLRLDYRHNKENLLTLAIEAVKLQATLNEIVKSIN